MSRETTLFEMWVKQHYSGLLMDEFPADWDRDKEFFYNIDGFQYRIPFAEVPKAFLPQIKAMARATS